MVRPLPPRTPLRDWPERNSALMSLCWQKDINSSNWNPGGHTIIDHMRPAEANCPREVPSRDAVSTSRVKRFSLPERRTTGAASPWLR
ncbi:hypothetical protein CHARACLAT_032430 [Characodon lateralis]|uniref:Uncharacterized protein n=1 Tax=Characodon lateralis TaxID=208331 RepID=A0ABU7DBY6_9TELE|nr:hypothetical protein [Characodon lateralis]